MLNEFDIPNIHRKVSLSSPVTKTENAYFHLKVKITSFHGPVLLFGFI